MSASLVGSEMCIRDSTNSANVAQEDEAAVSSSPKGRTVLWPASGLPPVSYTHLTLPTICSV
eukprot:5263461-Alexandrium_andersonii.AAC.1